MGSAPSIPPDHSAEGERARYLEGIRLFNAGRFFEAHEAWEDIWRCSGGVNREYYQGLVQCAVALEHFRRGNARGAVRLYGRCRRHFSSVPDVFMGLNVGRFLEEMKRALQPALDKIPVPERGELVLELSRAPQVVLECSP